MKHWNPAIPPSKVAAGLLQREGVKMEDEIIEDEQIADSIEDENVEVVAEVESDEPAAESTEDVAVDPPKSEGPKPLRDWAKKVAADNRELRRRLAEIEQKPAQEAPKPTLESCGFDEDTYAEKLLAWNESQSALRQAKAEQEKAQERAQQAWNAQVKSYQSEISKLGDEGKEAQAIVESFTNTQQQAILIRASSNPAQFIASLAKNEALLMKMAEIEDPIELAAFIGRNEVKKQAQSKPAPEGGIQRVTSPIRATNIEALREEARKTGDYSRVFAAQRLQKSKK